MIELKDIVVKFGDFEALHNINVNVKEGEFFTFLGPSGCGKTTTLRTITGFIEPVSGTVSVNEQDITHVPIEKRNIGIVFQSYALFPTMTVYDNIAFGLKLKKLKKPEIDQKVREIARKVDLSDEQLKKAVSQLSGGQQQRVAIARALASDPEVLLCDEATSALDPMTTQAILRLLQKINREMGITIVVITHEMAVIRQICTHVAILDGGVIAEEGSVDDVFTHTRSEAGKRLFGIVASENHEQVQEKPAIRIVFNGETIAEPIVADLILHLGVPLSIRSADVHTLNGAQYGQLLISRPDDPMVCHRAIEYLKERGLTVEEVRA